MCAHERVVPGVGSDVDTDVARPNEAGSEPRRSRPTKKVGVDAERFCNVDPEPIPIQLSDAKCTAPKDTGVPQRDRTKFQAPS